MKFPFPLLLRLLLAASLGAPFAFADSKLSLVTSVHSKLAPGYQRPKNKDGTFKRQYYAVSNGGHIPGTAVDSTIEKLQFSQLNGVLSQALAKQNYFLARDAKSADILLVVHWGRTVPLQDAGYTAAMNQVAASITQQNFDNRSASSARIAAGGSENASTGDSAVDAMLEAQRAAGIAVINDELTKLAMFNKIRDQANESNARLLGYIDEVNRVNDPIGRGPDYYYDLIGDLEDPRYYLIVTAFDFREMVEQKKQRLLWTTRVSIRAHGSAFDKDFAAMLAKAGRHFGQDSGGLLRRYDPKGRVDIGDLEVIGMAPTPAPRADEKK